MRVESPSSLRASNVRAEVPRQFFCQPLISELGGVEPQVLEENRLANRGRGHQKRKGNGAFGRRVGELRAAREQPLGQPSADQLIDAPGARAKVGIVGRPEPEVEGAEESGVLPVGPDDG
jgi:hypothetical protein